jgi:hypothetical protein
MGPTRHRSVGQKTEPVGRRNARPGRKRTRSRFRFYPAFWERVLPVQGVKYTFLFLANFTHSKTPFFQHGAKTGDEGTVHHIFEGVVIIAEAFIGAPVHALGLAPAAAFQNAPRPA